MEVTAALAGGLGLVTGALSVAAFWYSNRFRDDAGAATVTEQGAPGLAAVSEGLTRVLAVLPGAAFVVGADGSVLRATTRAVTLGLVHGDRVSVAQLAALAAQVRRDGVIREADLELADPPRGTQLRLLRARVAPLSSISTLVLVEDLSETSRVDAVRRDFVANVSHELKTPVGALALLAEAVQAASDEPVAVRRFSLRMQAEAARLTNLINDLIDLSRLQDTTPPLHVGPVPVSSLVSEAVAATRLVAQARKIEVVAGAVPAVVVQGDEGQLVMALRNLVTNAIAYSPPRTKVAVSASVIGELVLIAVTDQGIGITPAEQARIFERFYRVDPARSRVTGGTGLGLAIVKHVCANHGGECTVWSVPGEGSTFTLRLPVIHPVISPADRPAPAGLTSSARSAPSSAVPPRTSSDGAQPKEPVR